MEKLRSYLNSLSPREQSEFARSCGTSIGYLRKAISKNQRFRSDLCVLIEQKSSGQVTRKDLIEDWIRHWPELADVEDRVAASDDTQPPVGKSTRKKRK
jgi:DNA-binding transcriptional regulator YdaS (Cro superfamily)